MLPVEIIQKKEHREELTRNELEYFVKGYLNDEIPDYQMAAFLVAVYLVGMSEQETIDLTDLMLHSGKVIDLSHIPGIKVDKHSTGGVGDKVSIILAPLVAACGVPVPMISGRGLGHTGGTLDKLESIPGFKTDYDINSYKKIIKKIGLVMIGQTDEIAPADKKMYALRDVTATVECIPLIAASIMSKKLAEGIDALVLDIKTGSGAFMKSIENSIKLAETLIKIGEGFNKRTIGFITDMNQPLGNAVGNWVEVEECVRCLRSEEVPDLMTVMYQLAGAMVYLGGKADSIEEGEELARRILAQGKAYDKFLELVKTQEGDVSYIEDPRKYKTAKFKREVAAPSVGYVSKIDCEAIGLAGIVLGAGRRNLDDKIDPAAGILIHKKIGDTVEKGEPLVSLLSNREDTLNAAAKRIFDAYTITDDKISPPPLIYGYVDKDGYSDFTKS